MRLLRNFKIIVNLLFITCLLVSAAYAKSPLSLSHDCASLDPKMANSSGCYRLMTVLYEGLVRVGKDGNPEPGAADSWQFNLEEKTLTFALKNDRFWSDGAPVVADDYITSWLRSIADSKSGNPLRGSLLKIKGAANCVDKPLENCKAGIQAVDDKTILIQFEKLDRLFPLRTLNGGLMPIPSHFYQQYGDNWLSRLDVPFNGSYIPEKATDLDKSVSSEMFVVPNKRYPDITDKNIGQIKYHFEVDISSDDVRAHINSHKGPDVLFRVNNISEKMNQILEKNNWKAISQGDVGAHIIFMNRKHLEPELVDAIKLILSSEIYASRNPQLMGTVIPRFYNNVNNPVKKPLLNKLNMIPYPKRQDMAVELLKKIGITPKSRRSIRFLNRTSFRQRTFLVVSTMLRDYGIDLVALNVAQDKDIANSDSEMRNTNWFVSLPDPTGFFFTKGWSTYDLFSEEDDKKFENLLVKASQESDEARLNTLHEAETLFVNNSSAIPLFAPKNSVIYRNNICGVVSSQSLSSPPLWLRWCE